MSNNRETTEAEARRDGRREEKKADLRHRLIDAAEAQIALGGLAGLKARDVTQGAGCALGALYTAFDDLDALILHVNTRTLNRLGAALKAAVPPGGTPGETMQALSATYVDFALENRRLWSALFEHRLPEGVVPPDWHRQNHGVLIAQIVPPLRVLRPDLDEGQTMLRARTTFAAVHGVVHLSLQGRFVGVPETALRSEVAALVEALTRGATAVRDGG